LDCIESLLLPHRCVMVDALGLDLNPDEIATVTQDAIRPAIDPSFDRHNLGRSLQHSQDALFD
jgi:hypothetical protein